MMSIDMFVTVPEEPTMENIRPLLDLLYLAYEVPKDKTGVSLYSFCWLDDTIRQILSSHVGQWQA